MNPVKTPSVTNIRRQSPLMGSSPFDRPYGRDFTKEFNAATAAVSPATARQTQGPVYTPPRIALRQPAQTDLDKVRNNNYSQLTTWDGTNEHN